MLPKRLQLLSMYPRPMRLAKIIATFMLVSTAAAKKHDGDGDDDDDNVESQSTSSTIATSSSASPVDPTSTTQASTTPTPVTPQSTTVASATTASSTAVPTNALQFPAPSNVTTCEKATITWEFASLVHVPVTIVITNESLSPSNIDKRLEPVISQTLSTTVDAMTCEVNWPAVNVPAGQYNAVAFDTARNLSLSATSPPFFVTAGSNTTCLNSTSTSADTSSEVSSHSTSGSKSLSSGALVGTISGVVVGVIGLVIVFTLPRLRQRTRKPPRPGAPYQTF